MFDDGLRQHRQQERSRLLRDRALRESLLLQDRRRGSTLTRWDEEMLIQIDRQLADIEGHLIEGEVME